MKTWIADTGPLVALLAGDDHHHAWAVEQSRHAPSTVHSCQAVFSEACFLLQREGHPADDLFALVESGFLRCDFDFTAEAGHLNEMMRRYHTQPMSFADACLVRLAEILPDSCVWTIDRNFQVYRRNRRQTLSLVTPW